MVFVKGNKIRPKRRGRAAYEYIDKVKARGEVLRMKGPAWEALAEKVIRMKGLGMTEEEITTMVNEDRIVVTRILEDDNIADLRARKIFETEKLPLIKDILQASLNVVSKTLKEINEDDDMRHQFISKASDIALMIKSIESLNTIVRLELGKSTKNIETHAHNYQQTREAIQNLKTVDPVFDYPELPPPVAPPPPPEVKEDDDAF